MECRGESESLVCEALNRAREDVHTFNSPYIMRSDSYCTRRIWSCFWPGGPYHTQMGGGNFICISNESWLKSMRLWKEWGSVRRWTEVRYRERKKGAPETRHQRGRFLQVSALFKRKKWYMRGTIQELYSSLPLTDGVICSRLNFRQQRSSRCWARCM